MRIGLFSSVFSKRGGISKYVCELSERFVAEHEVHLVTSDYSYKPIEGLRVHNVQNIKRPPSLFVASTAFQYSRVLPKIKREYGLDIVHTQGADAVNRDVVTAYSVHKAAVEQFMRERGRLYRMLKPFEPRTRMVLAIEKLNFEGGKLRKAIAVSNNVKDDLIRFYGTPADAIDVVYPGVDTKEYTPEKKPIARQKIRPLYGIPDGSPLAMFIGWEFKRKGLMQVVRAMPKLKDMHLLVVGRDERSPYEAEAKKLGVFDRLHFAGFVEDITLCYAAADIMVFPTAYEPFGSVIVEAMACGTPVVSTKCAGAAELITEGKDGMLIEDPYDHNELAKDIAHILDNNLASGMGKEACKSVKICDWDNVAKNTLKVYEAAMRR
jgi:UDP-glucose:(heptosyl)LPS alpha-1,3-glucosyltransferase